MFVTKVLEENCTKRKLHVVSSLWVLCTPDKHRTNRLNN